MRFCQKIKVYLLAEIANLKTLPPRDRLWYIWEYHKFHIAVILFASILLITVLGNTFFPTQAYLNNAAINLTGERTSEYASLTTEAQEVMGLGNRDIITLSPFYLSFQASYQMEHTMALQSLLVRIAAKDVDLMFLPESDFYAMESANIYCNIKQLLPTKLWDAVKSNAIYITDSETGSEYPAALDITSLPAIDCCDFITDSVVVCFSPTTQHIENCCAMIAYLFGLDIQAH